MKRLAFLFPAVLALTACAGTVDDDDAESSESALTAAQCATPTINTVPKTDSAGRPISGTAKTTLKGCIVGRANETGASVIARSTTILGDTAKIGQMKDDAGRPVFSQFTPRQPTGSLTSSSGLVQEIDVKLNVDYSPYGRLRVTRKASSDGSYAVSITNSTAFKATILFFPVEVIKPGNLKLDVTLKPESNGITVTGATEVALEQAHEQAAQSSQLGRDMFEWLRDELAR